MSAKRDPGDSELRPQDRPLGSTRPPHKPQPIPVPSTNPTNSGTENQTSSSTNDTTTTATTTTTTRERKTNLVDAIQSMMNQAGNNMGPVGVSDSNHTNTNNNNNNDHPFLEPNPNQRNLSDMYRPGNTIGTTLSHPSRK
ncbi:hypothetical protein IV203_012880 [Nitzschia inconspicua]|uniref:Uncharacterized protein n=1 Tax=Nitzschia inconspicua TaxID=303405 RepID=A0A9K3M5W6_9STRA|nr:hypothetical protein IV203_012880 [Nitzschia inconspicua]